MKNRILYLFMVLLIASCGSDKTAGISSDVSGASASSKVTIQSILSNMEKGTYKEGEILVKFKSGIAASSSLRTNQALGAETIKRYSVVPSLEHVKLPEGVSVRDAMTKYMSDPNVEYAEPNYIRCASVTPNDPFFVNHEQWALFNTGQYAGGTAGDDIGAPFAWDITTGLINNPVKIAILDSGVDVSHPDLAGNIWSNPSENCSDGVDHDLNGLVNDCRGWNFVDGTNDVSDDIGHGTHLAGIIGAAGNNGLGMAGVMWHVQMIPLKIFNASNDFVTGSCISAFVSEEIAAIQYAVSHGANVINASFRSEGFCQSEHDAISAANTAGVLFVAAAGNGGLDSMGINNDVDPQYPASYELPNIISVAATDQNDRLASFSNFGPKSVHVAAPGVYILSTVPFSGIAESFSSLCTGSFDVGYDLCSGTSMAAPHVSGLAGLLFSQYGSTFASDTPQVRAAKIRGMIIKYVVGQTSLENTIFSKGRISASAAVGALLAPANFVATPLSPDQISLSWTVNSTGEDGFEIERMVSGGGFAHVASVGHGVSSFTDSGLSASTTYTYRLRAFSNTLPNPPSASYISAKSDSAQTSATTLPAGTPPPVEPASDGGGGCSVGARQNTPTAFADLGILLMPLLLMMLIRRKK